MNEDKKDELIKQLKERVSNAEKARIELVEQMRLIDVLVQHAHKDMVEFYNDTEKKQYFSSAMTMLDDVAITTSVWR